MLDDFASAYAPSAFTAQQFHQFQSFRSRIDADETAAFCRGLPMNIQHLCLDHEFCDTHWTFVHARPEGISTNTEMIFKTHNLRFEYKSPSYINNSDINI